MPSPDRGTVPDGARHFRSPTSQLNDSEGQRGHQRVGGNLNGSVDDANGSSRKQDTWVKSSLSFANGNCVELAMLEQDVRGLRDSYNPGTIITVSPKALKKLLNSIKKGKFSN